MGGLWPDLPLRRHYVAGLGRGRIRKKPGVLLLTSGESGSPPLLTSTAWCKHVLTTVWEYGSGGREEQPSPGSRFGMLTPGVQNPAQGLPSLAVQQSWAPAVLLAVHNTVMPQPYTGVTIRNTVTPVWWRKATGGKGNRWAYLFHTIILIKM